MQNNIKYNTDSVACVEAAGAQRHMPVRLVLNDVLGQRGFCVRAGVRVLNALAMHRLAKVLMVKHSCFSSSTLSQVPSGRLSFACCIACWLMKALHSIRVPAKNIRLHQSRRLSICTCSTMWAAPHILVSVPCNAACYTINNIKLYMELISSSLVQLHDCNRMYCLHACLSIQSPCCFRHGDASSTAQLKNCTATVCFPLRR